MCSRRRCSAAAAPASLRAETEFFPGRRQDLRLGAKHMARSRPVTAAPNSGNSRFDPGPPAALVLEKGVNCGFTIPAFAPKVEGFTLGGDLPVRGRSQDARRRLDRSVQQHDLPERKRRPDFRQGQARRRGSVHTCVAGRQGQDCDSGLRRARFDLDRERKTVSTRRARARPWRIPAISSSGAVQTGRGWPRPWARRGCRKCISGLTDPCRAPPPPRTARPLRRWTITSAGPAET